MDCASEESETCRGLDGVDGIRSLSFRLGERSLRIDAAPAVTEQAVSGVIVEGRSAINQAPVTGESIPVDKGPGDAVFAGTINPTATFSMRVTAVSTNSTLSRIIHAVEQAQASRAPTQRFVDRFAAIYTLAVFVLALAVALAGLWLFGWAWPLAVYKALALLVIACPCALLISTPVTVVSGLATAARRGILIKGGAYLEEARLLKAIALDKTGTITEGKPKLVEWLPLNPGLDRLHIEHIAAVLATHSDHPVSRAIAAGLTPNSAEPKNFSALAARGVQAEIDGVVYVLGNHRSKLLPEGKRAAIKALQAQYGPTAMTGDGINDAPALAQADIGVAMGAAGTDIAMEAADVVVMNDDLRRIAETVRLSRKTHAVLWQNIILALGIKAVFLALALFDSASMWMAVLTDMGASLLVVANGLRLLRHRASP